MRKQRCKDKGGDPEHNRRIVSIGSEMLVANCGRITQLICQLFLGY
uniref:Uncharacterized protein n=1 Tax=Heterorhabditis bacteriophora TaxID=37862 RepID=A0A1I7X1A6_HETBA